MINFGLEGRSIARSPFNQTLRFARPHHTLWVIGGLATGLAVFAAAALMVSDNHAGSDVASTPTPSQTSIVDQQRPVETAPVAAKVDRAVSARRKPANDNEIAAAATSSSDGAEQRETSTNAHNPSTSGLRASAAQQVTNALVATL